MTDDSVNQRLAELERGLANLESTVNFLVVSYCKQQLAIKTIQDFGANRA
jgi:uncharacterized coiled-coil protein SlyX